MLTARFCSKRAKTLVDLCENAPSPTSSEVSAISSCFSMSPGWDSIFEALDMAADTNIQPTNRSVNSVKRKLSFSPMKDVELLLPAVHDVGCPIRSQEQEIKVHEKEFNCLDLCPSPANKIQSGVNHLSDAEELLPVHDPGCSDNCVRSQEQEIKVHEKEFNCLDLCPSPANKIQSGVNHLSDAEVLLPVHDPGCSRNSVRSQEDEKKVNRSQLYPSQKKIIAAKLALNAGKEHVTTEGKLKKGRSLKPSCKESCKRCAKPKLTLSERLQINSEFWALMDHVRQWKFISRSVTCTLPKRKTCNPGAKGEKHSSRVYYFHLSNTPKIVCKTMFKSTLSICDSWIDSALAHFNSGEMTCDKRGSNKSQLLKKIVDIL